MNFWEVFGIGVFVGAAIGMWITYGLLAFGEWRNRNEQNNSLYNSNPI